MLPNHHIADTASLPSPNASVETFPVRVSHKQHEALDICRIEFTSLDGSPLPAFSAGAHIDVHLPNGLMRQYSLCNAPSETHRYVIGVLKDPATRGGSKALHELIHPGSVLQISAPKNRFALDPNAKHSILVAGGIGVTPLLSMAEMLTTNGQDFQMHYATRSPERAAFREHICASKYAHRVHFYFDDGPSEHQLNLGHVVAERGNDDHLYVCGPGGFIEAVLSAARSHGWPDEQLHREFFKSDAAQQAADTSFEVQLASSGRVITIPADKSVLETLAEAGIELPASCEQGTCGTCLTHLLSGEPDHRDTYLTPQEQAANDRFMPCCSRAKSQRLVLDL